MVVASGRWLGVRLDFLSELFIGAVAVLAVIMSQDAGKRNEQMKRAEEMSVNITQL